MFVLIPSLKRKNIHQVEESNQFSNPWRVRDKTGRTEVGVGSEGDGDAEAFWRRKLLICRADKVNSDGL